MNEEIKRTYESLPEEEKEQLQKYQKKGITKVTQSVDQETGKILSTETTYSSEKKRVKGTFGISSPEEIIRLARQNKIRAINTMLPYFIDNMNWNNELSFDNTFIESYGEQNKTRFYADRRYLLKNQYIFEKPNKKNIYTLNVNLLFRGTMQKAAELYEEQFGEGVIIMHNTIQLVPYTDEYYDFVYEVKKNAYKKYVEECWGKWDEEAQKEYFKKFIETYKNSAYIIKVDEQDVGFYNDEELDDGSYEVGNICIKPEFQGKGLGTMILKNKLEEHKNQDIRIQFFKQNPVGKLYERLGFVPNGETEFHYQMIKPKQLNKVK